MGKYLVLVVENGDWMEVLFQVYLELEVLFECYRSLIDRNYYLQVDGKGLEIVRYDQKRKYVLRLIYEVD